MAYRDPWRDAVESAKQLLRLGMSPEKVVERTRLPKSTIDRIAPPILRENAEREAIGEAERAVKREQERILKEKYPCPLCHKGYGIVSGGVLTAFLDGSVCRIGDEVETAGKGSAFFRPYYAHCSNKRCVAQLVFPRDSHEEALNAFVLGEWVKPYPFVSVSDHSEWTYTKQGLASVVSHLLDDYTPEQVKQLGFNPAGVDEIAGRKLIQMAKFNPDAFDTTLMCPKCGGRGEFRKAVNPTNHSKESWCCWWRVGCPKCGARTVNSFPTQEQAQSAFEADDLLREPENVKGKES